MTIKEEARWLTMLRSVELIQDLETEHLKKLAAAAGEVTFAENEIIYQEGEKGTAVYIIQSGQVVIEMEAPGQGWITTLTLGPNDLFGWSSLFPDERKKARARATESTRALAIDAERVRMAWRGDQEFESAIIKLTSKVMVDRIRLARQQLIDALASGESG